MGFSYYLQTRGFITAKIRVALKATLKLLKPPFVNEIDNS